MKKLHSLWLVAAIAATLTAAPAFAQEGDETGGDDAPAEEADVDSAIDDAITDVQEEPEPEPEPAQGDEASADDSADTAAASDANLEEELEEDADPLEELEPGDKLYWSSVRGVYTLQQREFTKNRRFGITLYGGLIPNNIFEQYIPVGLRLNYFILENIGVELAGSYAFKDKTRLEPLIREQGGVGAGQVLIGDTQVSHTNFGVVWSPFYGKSAFYDNSLVHFDLFLFAGAGVVVAETTPNFNADPEQEIKPEGALGAGLAFFFGNHFAGRLDFRQFVFQKITGGVANPSEVSLGVSYFF